MKEYYDSPIDIVTQQMATSLSEFIDNAVYKACLPFCVDVDKEKLVQALQQDKKRYTEAYRKGFIDSRAQSGWRVCEDGRVRCQNCSHAYDIDKEKWDFCPNCGAYMTYCVMEEW